MRWAALIVLAVAVLLVPVALAADGKPQKKLTKAGQARARAAAVKASDVGAGWTPQSSKDDDQSNPRCGYYNPDQSDLIEIGSFDSPDFTRSDGSFVSSTTGVFKTAGMARAGFARVAMPTIARCFGELFRKAIAKPNIARIHSTGPLTFPRVGERSAAYRINASFKVPTATVPVTIDIVLFNRGQVDVGVIFLGIGKPLPPSFERGLVARVAARTG